MKNITVSKNPNINWNNNEIQFPRLIAELEAAGAFTSQGLIQTLTEEMDLTEAEILELVDRAQTKWDEIKAKL